MWLSVSKLSDGATGTYLKIAPLSNQHTYDLYYKSADGSVVTQTQIICTDGLSQRKTSTVPLIDPDDIYLKEAIKMGW